MTNGGRPAGWYEEEGRPGVQRYWGGDGWDDSVPPRPTPETKAPVWRQAWPVVLGILIAAAIIFTVWRLQQPDCEQERDDYFWGFSSSIDPACA